MILYILVIPQENKSKCFYAVVGCGSLPDLPIGVDSWPVLDGSTFYWVACQQGFTPPYIPLMCENGAWRVAGTCSGQPPKEFN